MPAPIMHKDVPVGEFTYRIHRLKADVGSWLSILLTTKMRETRERATEASVASNARAQKAAKAAAQAAQKEVDAEAAKLSYEDGMMMTATFLIANLSRAELKEVQPLCLERVSRLEVMAGVPTEIPVCDSGVWMVPELEYDAPTVLELTKQSLAFNIAPFFPAPASN